MRSWFEYCLKGILFYPGGLLLTLRLPQPCSMIPSFFTAGSHLSCEAKKEVVMYQEQILAYLENHSKSTHSTISQRFSKLLLRLGSIQSISKEMMQYLEVQQTLGHTHMGKLLLELFDSHLYIFVLCVSVHVRAFTEAPNVCECRLSVYGFQFE